MEIFSKRQKAIRGDVNDILTYDRIPHSLRVQIIYIITDAIGSDNSDYSIRFYKNIDDTLKREYGLRILYFSNYTYPRGDVQNFIERETDVEKVLDAVELCFQKIEAMSRSERMTQMYHYEASINEVQAIELLNKRFREHGVGYSYQNGEIIRIDSIVSHQEIVLPAIKLLNNPLFEGANAEYMSAHEHYRHGRNKECLVDCLKAFESVLKTICTTKQWAFDETRDTASKLIDICFQNGLIPAYAQNQFTSLKQLLVTGIPTVRNRNAGHGQGVEPQEVDDEIVRYGLNLTGTNIIFLIELSKI